MDYTILLANPRGFCAGVDRAIDVVDDMLREFGSPIYVRREIVHNRDVVDELRSRGVVFVDEVDEIPDGAIAVFSAHGVAPSVRRKSAERGLRVVDATCPLVSKVHTEALRFSSRGMFVILVGHGNHDEVEGTLGHVQRQGIALVENVGQAWSMEVPDATHVGVITQTTLSIDDAREILDVLRRRFPLLQEPSRSDICYATQNRQLAVSELASKSEVVLVVGSANSSNSQRLRERASQHGCRSYLLDNEDELNPSWLEGAATIGITSGASSPERLLRRIVDRIQGIRGPANIREIGNAEPGVRFVAPSRPSSLDVADGVPQGVQLTGREA